MTVLSLNIVSKFAPAVQASTSAVVSGCTQLSNLLRFELKRYGMISYETSINQEPYIISTGHQMLTIQEQKLTHTVRLFKLKDPTKKS